MPPLITPAAAEDIPTVRTLFAHYAAALGVPLCFQGFQEELDSLPGAYAPPEGALLVARLQTGGPLVGCVGMRPLEPGICEMKRLYVCAEARGHGVGRALLLAVLAAGRAAGYQAMRLDTLPIMGTAQALYAAHGFYDIAPYYDNPIPGARYLECRLDAAAS